MAAPESKTSKRQITAREREAQAIGLRLSGATYQQIADVIGYRGPSSAFNAVIRGLDRMLPVQEADDLRRIMAAQIDKLTFGIWKQATGGHLGALDRVVRLMERKARLLGLDAPVRADITTDGKPIPGPVIYLPAVEDSNA